MLTTTLKQLRKYGACTDRYAHLRKMLGKRYGDNTPITIVQILDSNGFDDALWALRACGGAGKLARKFACRCVRETPLRDGRTVWDLLGDKRFRNAVIASERFADGEITEEELAAARSAARAAAWDAALDAALDAARAAALDAARAAAWDAARSAARAAARSAARSAPWAAAWDAQERIFREIFS